MAEVIGSGNWMVRFSFEPLMKLHGFLLDKCAIGSLQIFDSVNLIFLLNLRKISQLTLTARIRYHRTLSMQIESFRGILSHMILLLRFFQIICKKNRLLVVTDFLQWLNITVVGFL